MPKITAFEDKYGVLHKEQISSDMEDIRYDIEEAMTAYNFTEADVRKLLRIMDDALLNNLIKHKKLHKKSLRLEEL